MSNYSVYDYSNFGKKKFIHDYSLIDWSFLDNSDVYIHDHFNTFYDKTTECISNHIHKRKASKRDPKLRSKPWIVTETQRLVNYRDKSFNNVIKNPSPSNKYLYRKFRNCVVSEKRREKSNYFQRHTKQI